MDEHTQTTENLPAPSTSSGQGFFELIENFDGSMLTELLIGLGSLAFLVWLAHLVSSKIGLRAIIKFTDRTATEWDNILARQKVFHRLVPIAPLIVLQLGIYWVPNLPLSIAQLIATVAFCFIIICITRSFSAAMTAIDVIYNRFSKHADRPIKGYLQVVQVLGFIVAALLIVSALVGKSPLILLSGLGAITAVLSLVFRNSLLSLVAGIQLTQNDLIRVGDWIEMPQFNADGFVTEVALNTVTVRNWDRTSTVIPAHNFLEHSFKNWRGMFEGGGRRIKRSIYIDMSTIRFLTDQEIEQLRSIALLRDYLDAKKEELCTYNTEHVPPELARRAINRRNLTNIGTFRAYILAYLRQHPELNQDLLLVVRQLQPTHQGLPLEIYAFTKDTRFVIHEGIQSDIFDHLLAVITDFGLRVYQSPSGVDIAGLASRSTQAAPHPVAPEIMSEMADAD